MLLAPLHSVSKQTSDQVALIFSKTTLDDILHPLLVLDESANICAFNQAYSSECGSTEVSIIADSLYDVHQGQWNIPEIHTLLHDVIVQGHHYAIVKVSSKFLGVDLKTLVFYARQIKRHDSTMILLSIEDATAYNEAA
ncbi:hypothetical protein CCAX7_35980 [Capsulimonas corticalis]|uniref:Uncharacterized protein n=2 Tax=Capsulimonas corticalis TaxID=2219043 RepID=A0A402D776_9BACT|nr:hypothetical protein CCAX7_35980 [Capsulimonas corticalis]